MKRSARKTLGPTDVVRVGTRATELARRRAAIVEASVVALGREVEVIEIRTAADRKKKILSEPAEPVGLFTRELEAALARGKVDCCVHSLPDLPTGKREGLEIAAVLQRGDPRDALVLNPIANAAGLEDLASGSRVGTSSSGARAQLLAARPDLDVVDLLGDVPERLRKLDEGRLHGAVIRASSLMLLGARQRVSQPLEPPGWLPVPGQGAVAVQVRAADEGMRSLASSLNHAATHAAVRAERAFLAALDAGSEVVAGALVVGETLHGFVSDVSGRNIIRGSIPFNPDAAEQSGDALARDVRERGGESLLAELRGVPARHPPQPE